MQENDLQQSAATLLMSIWAGIPKEYKIQYRRNIWEQFEGAVKTSAYTNNLGKFTSQLCSRFSASIPDFMIHETEGILNSGEDNALLKILRNETTLIVLMVRVENDERKEKYQNENIST